jgi:hypothetical protein
LAKPFDKANQFARIIYQSQMKNTEYSSGKAFAAICLSFIQIS